MSSCIEEGCLDPRAENYNDGADRHNGECEYVGCLKADVACKNGGTCQENGGCDCPTGYYGERCEKTKKPSAFSIETIFLINNEFDNKDLFITIEGASSGEEYVKTDEKPANKGDTLRYLGINDVWYIDSVDERNTVQIKKGFANSTMASFDTVLYRKEIGLPDTLRYSGINDQDFTIELVVDYRF